MKKLVLFVLFLTSFVSFSQETQNQQRTIRVTGSAKMEIIPDEVNLKIELKEFYKEEYEGKKVKRYKTKITIETLENELFQNLKKHGIKNENITISEIQDFDYYKGKESLLGKTYIIKLDSFGKANELIKFLNFKGLEDVGIHSYNHSKITEFRKQTKINAIVAARDKAKYLLEAIGSILGKPIEIRENDYSFPSYNNSSLNSLTANVLSRSNSKTLDFENSKKIILRYEIHALFEIE
ncbi:SIMPL domain-containing protein [Aureivirga marina]|uniref:SIMPL domain-containing protein n=1 Tax=Aureivirga marina TaxID=1182451 RepID=UPI0018C9B93F|nr:SIMPL domain-containing protein [Aureivirga marina]